VKKLQVKFLGGVSSVLGSTEIITAAGATTDFPPLLLKEF